MPLLKRCQGDLCLPRFLLVTGPLSTSTCERDARHELATCGLQSATRAIYGSRPKPYHSCCSCSDQNRIAPFSSLSSILAPFSIWTFTAVDEKKGEAMRTLEGTSLGLLVRGPWHQDISRIAQLANPTSKKPLHLQGGRDTRRWELYRGEREQEQP